MKNNPINNFFTLIFIAVLLFGCKNEKTFDISPVAIETALSEINPTDFQNENQARNFYKNNGNQSVWKNETPRNSFFEELKKADKEGLDFQDYHGKALQNSIKNVENLSENERAKMELLLTDAFFEYAHDLYYGKTDPKKLNEIWGIHRKEINFQELLKKAVKEKNISEVLGALRPNHEIYKGLKQSLSEYRKKLKSEKEFEKIPTGKTIEPGKSDPRIPQIAARLKQLGMLDENYRSQDSLYNEKLQSAVETFQTKKILATDKILGNSTIAQLNKTAQDRYDQLLVNLERWRWYPRDFGAHYIIINIPNYELDVVKNGEILRAHNVIAGDPSHHTPIFSDSIQYIVLNPQWHIPSSIAVNEIIPSARKNPNYLSSRNIFVTNSKGERVDPSKINWDSAANYSFTQGSGASNSLGHVKIIYPNKYAIYLHDTPAKAIFEQNFRAESHGCVRVENAVGLAAYLLNDQSDWSLEKIQETISSGQTKKVHVTQHVNVYHLYWTAWRENGKTVFANDVYDLDDKVYEALVK